MGNYFSFSNEQFACKVIPASAMRNDHLANIIDYHYGLTHNYVVYEDVGSNYDWKSLRFAEFVDRVVIFVNIRYCSFLIIK